MSGECDGWQRAIHEMRPTECADSFSWTVLTPARLSRAVSEVVPVAAQPVIRNCCVRACAALVEFARPTQPSTYLHMVVDSRQLGDLLWSIAGGVTIGLSVMTMAMVRDQLCPLRLGGGATCCGP